MITSRSYSVHSFAASFYRKNRSSTVLIAEKSRKFQRAVQPKRGYLNIRMGFFSNLFGGIQNAAPKSLRQGCQLAPAEAPEGLACATFCGGCFWGLELAYQREPGVTNTSVGYTLGKQANPTYEWVCSGTTDHAEAVQVYYDPPSRRHMRGYWMCSLNM
eukprot:jgi/Botrbrau1/12213/Bobra.0197s0007.1